MPKPKNADPASYEAALEELEQLVGRIESGQMPLEQLLAGYQRGATLLAFCRDRLEAVQEQVRVLDGGALQPLDTGMNRMDQHALQVWSSAHLAQVEQALERWVGGMPLLVSGQAMRYAVLDGGKRLRPLLVMAAREAIAAGDGDAQPAPGRQKAVPRTGFDEAALRAACAVELIHAYSLVHDDMPCMDNDVLRRGKPTVHVQFGQAQALLAGDALQALAFELLTPEDAGVPAAVQARLCRLLAHAAGSSGMAGGQAIDLASVGVALDEARLREMHRLKTGALLQSSVMMGAACGEASAAAWAGLSAYGAALGLAFQVVDDILDVTQDSATLGKTAGKDAAQDKPTYVSLLGLDRAQAQARDLLDQAHAALEQTALPDTRALAALADMVVSRSH